MKEKTFGMIKPEAISRNLVNEIVRRIENADLTIEGFEKRKLTTEEFNQIYGHTEKTIPKMYLKLKNHLTKNEVILLLVKGEKAIEKLLALRGSSNPSDALPGTIRGDFAKDQDYKKLSGKNEISLNVFHSSDSKEEADKMIKSFFNKNDK